MHIEIEIIYFNAFLPLPPSLQVLNLLMCIFTSTLAVTFICVQYKNKTA